MPSDRQKAVPASPYRGIHPFRYVDQQYFYGREETVSALPVKVLVSRLVVLFGESGTGKSSLLNAGLIPVLEKEGLAPERLRVRPIADEPLLVERVPVDADEAGPFLPSIFASQESAGDAVAEAVIPCSLEQLLRTVHETDRYPVLIFDQFEELFTLFGQHSDTAADEESLEAAILEALFQVVGDRTLKAKVIITLREDFLGRLEVLAKNYPPVFDHRVRLGRLDRDAARQAILGPFADTNPFPTRLTPELADTIVEGLAVGQATAGIGPTQLQIICRRLWDEYAGRKSEITVENFRELGEIKGILEGFLNSELGQLSPAEKSRAVVVLSSLITKSETRDVVSEDRLRHVLASEKDEDQEEPHSGPSVLEYLEERRVIYRTARRGTYYYELAHDYLIRPIQRLARERELLRAQERAAVEAAKREREAARQRELTQAQALAEEQERRAEAEHERAEQKARAAGRLRRLAIALAAVFLLAMGAGVFAGIQRLQAQASAAEARAAQETAEAEATIAADRLQVAQDTLVRQVDLIEQPQQSQSEQAALERKVEELQSLAAEATTPTPSLTSIAVDTPPAAPTSTPTPTIDRAATATVVALQLEQVKATQTSVAKVLSASTPEPAFPTGEHIAFISTRQGGSDLFIMAASGEGQGDEQFAEQIPLGPCNTFFAGCFQAGKPRLGPGGRQFLFHFRAPQDDGGTAFDIFLAQLLDDRAEVARNLTSDQGWDQLEGTWSSDGRRIAFLSTYGDRNRIWLMDADGGNKTPLTSGSPYKDEQPAWSPTGEWIATASQELDSSAWELLLVNPDDGEQRRQLTETGGINRAPAWSPEGRRLAFARGDDSPEDICIINWDRTGERCQQTPWSEDHPAWSPDGNWIAFDRYIDAESRTEIFLMRADFSEEYRVTYNRADDWGPVWVGE